METTTYTTQPKLPTIALFPVDSSKILAAGYDAATKTLGMQFKDNPDRTYHYKDVPDAVWDGFQKAESKGAYLRGTIAKCFGFTRYEADGAVSKTVPAPQQEEQPQGGTPAQEPQPEAARRTTPTSRSAAARAPGRPPDRRACGEALA